jgi:cytochrome c
MKKTIVIISLITIFYACGGNEDNSSANNNGGTQAAANSDADKGLELVGKSDCFGCHKVKEPSVGPAYNLVAQKYENTEANINMLAEKLTKGGFGNWGTVPMAAHPNVSKEDAILMAKYVLSLKDEK